MLTPISAPSTKNRAWVATYFGDDVAQMNETLQASGIESTTYGLSGLEVCPSTGRQHLQMYIRFKNAVRFNTVKELLPESAHVEPAKGSFKQNFTYCTKDGAWIEWGERPSVEGHIKGLYTNYDLMGETFNMLTKVSDETALTNIMGQLINLYEELGLDLEDIEGLEDEESEDDDMES